MNYTLRLSAVIFYLFSLIAAIRSQHQQSCPPPDVPNNGKYQLSSLLPGDQVTYSCNPGYTLIGKKVRMCQSSFTWSDSSPFCDRPVKLKSLRGSRSRDSSLSGSLSDDNVSTCFNWSRKPGESIFLTLQKEVYVLELRIFLHTGFIRFKILTGRSRNLKICTEYEGYIAAEQWVSIKCNSKSEFTDTVEIRDAGDKDDNITMCAIQVFALDEFGCEKSPQVQISHGSFVVERSIATLTCEEGYWPKNGRLNCESNSWKGPGPRCDELLCDPSKSKSKDPGVEWVIKDAVRKVSAGTMSELQCANGYRKVGSPDKVFCKKDGTWSKTNATCIEKEKAKTSTRSIVIGAAGSAAVIIIIVLLAITICLIKKQRNREVVVVYKSATGGSISGGADMEYGSAHYETIQYSVPGPPNSPRPVGFPTVLDEKYILPEDCQKTLRKQNQTPVDIAFGTLKTSTLYGR